MHLKRTVREVIRKDVTGEVVSFCCEKMAELIRANAGIRHFMADGFSFGNTTYVHKFCQFCGAKVRMETERILPKGYFRKLS